MSWPVVTLILGLAGEVFAFLGWCYHYDSSGGSDGE